MKKGSSGQVDMNKRWRNEVVSEGGKEVGEGIIDEGRQGRKEHAKEEWMKKSMNRGRKMVKKA